LKSFPALTQSNLEYELQEEPYFKPTYQEIDTTHISNYKNYVFQAQSSKHWKNAEFNGFNLPAQGEYKPYCMKWVSWGCDNVREHPNKKHYAEHEVKTCKVAYYLESTNRSKKPKLQFIEKLVKLCTKESKYQNGLCCVSSI
jgi:hypothetical protein